MLFKHPYSCTHTTYQKQIHRRPVQHGIGLRYILHTRYAIRNPVIRYRELKRWGVGGAGARSSIIIIIMKEVSGKGTCFLLTTFARHVHGDCIVYAVSYTNNGRSQSHSRQRVRGTYTGIIPTRYPGEPLHILRHG